MPGFSVSSYWLQRQQETLKVNPWVCKDKSEGRAVEFLGCICGARTVLTTSRKFTAKRQNINNVVAKIQVS